MGNGLWYTHDMIFGSLLILMLQRTSMSFKSWFRALEEAGGFWLGFGIVKFIWIWSLVLDTPMIQNLALYLDFEGAKNIHVLKVLVSRFGGCWMFLTEVWYLDLGLVMVTGLWCIHGPNFVSLLWFLGDKEHLCPLSTDLGIWGGWRFMTEVWHLDLDLDMVTGLWYTHGLNFGSLF